MTFTNAQWEEAIVQLANNGITVTASVDGANAAGIVALTSPPTATNAGSDTALTFSSQINQLKMQNNTSANVYYDYDTPATLGSRVLAPGYFLADPKKLTMLNLYTVAAQNVNGSAVGSRVLAPGYFLADPKKLTVLHLYTVAAQNVNGSAVGGIVVLGEL